MAAIRSSPGDDEEVDVAHLPAHNELVVPKTTGSEGTDTTPEEAPDSGSGSRRLHPQTPLFQRDRHNANVVRLMPPPLWRLTPPDPQPQRLRLALRGSPYGRWPSSLSLNATPTAYTYADYRTCPHRRRWISVGSS